MKRFAHEIHKKTKKRKQAIRFIQHLCKFLKIIKNNVELSLWHAIHAKFPSKTGAPGILFIFYR